VLAALANPRRQVSRLLATQAFLERHGEDLRDRRPPETVDNDMLERILGPEAAHQGIAALARPLDPLAVEELMDHAAGLDTATLLVLDEVTDPRNVGAVLRSAAAFGAAGLIVTRHNAAQETGALAKAAAGALDRVPIAEAANLRRAIEHLKEAGFWCLGLDHPAPVPLGREAPPARTAWILGAEGRGLRQLTARSCDALVEIPITAAMESLNVSNAAAIALYEWARHHGAARTSGKSDN
jgi:23S rRNA (guanosine2251-2'-O)-methyltransferase